MSQEQPKLMSEDDLLRISKIALVLLQVEAGATGESKEKDLGPPSEDKKSVISAVRRKHALDLHHELQSWFEVPLDPPLIPDYITVLNNVSLIQAQKADPGVEDWLAQSRGLAYMLYIHLCNHEVIQKKKEEGEWPAPMAEDEMKKLVKDCIHGLVFTAHNLGPGEGHHIVSSVFMPLAFGAFLDRARFELENLGTFYEYMSEEGPRTVNGYPTFFSVRIINKRDWDRCFEAIKAAEKALEDIEL